MTSPIDDAEPLDSIDDLDEFPKPSASLDDFTQREHVDYLLENTDLFVEALRRLAEDNPETFDDLIDEAETARRRTGRQVAGYFQTLAMLEQEDAWTRIVEIAKLRRLALADLL